MLIPVKSTPMVLVMISSICLPIRNRFHASQAKSEKITTFKEALLFANRMHRPLWTYIGGRDLDCQNLHLMAKFHTQVVLIIFPAQITLKMRIAARNREEFIKTPILRVQGHSRSLMLTFLRSLSPLVVMISNMSVPICNYFSRYTSQQR